MDLPHLRFLLSDDHWQIYDDRSTAFVARSTAFVASTIRSTCGCPSSSTIRSTCGGPSSKETENRGLRSEMLLPGASSTQKF